MHLRERRAREWDRVDEREQRVDASSEFLAEPGLHFLERARRNAVLKLLQLGAEFRRQEVRQNADELADLDEQAAQIEDRVREAPRVSLVPLDELRVVEARTEERSPDAKPRVAGENAN